MSLLTYLGRIRCTDALKSSILIRIWFPMDLTTKPNLIILKEVITQSRKHLLNNKRTHALGLEEQNGKGGCGWKV